MVIPFLTCVCLCVCLFVRPCQVHTAKPARPTVCVCPPDINTHTVSPWALLCTQPDGRMDGAFPPTHAHVLVHQPVFPTTTTTATRRLRNLNNYWRSEFFPISWENIINRFLTVDLICCDLHAVTKVFIYFFATLKHEVFLKHILLPDFFPNNCGIFSPSRCCHILHYSK